MRNLYCDPKFALAKMWFVDACIASQAYDKMLRHALETFGDHGPGVSGAGRDHFPEKTKQRLRDKCRWVRWCSDMAWECKPKRVHNSTMRELARQCANKHGFGFYGPQGDAS